MNPAAPVIKIFLGIYDDAGAAASSSPIVDTSSSAIFLIYSVKQSLDQNSRDHKQQITVFAGITEEGRERREREREGQEPRA
jgi:hypothetical protein